DMQEVRTYIDAGLKLLQEPVEASLGDVSRDRVAFLTYQALWYLREGGRPEASPAERAELAGQAMDSGNEALSIAEEKNDAIALWITLDALGFIYRTLHKYHESHSVQHRRLELVSAISSREELHDLYFSLGWAHERISDAPS